MALAFVESAVLSSEDGVTFNKEKDIPDSLRETGGQKRAMPWAPEGSNKSLGEQLAESKAKKDAEWKEANNPFKPPPGLDEEDFDFYESVEAKKEQSKIQKKIQADQDSRSFNMAQLAKVKPASATSMTTSFKDLEEPPPPVSAPVPLVVKKKHVEKDGKHKKSKSKSSLESDSAAKKAKKSKKSDRSEATPEGGLSLLGSYDSD